MSLGNQAYDDLTVIMGIGQARQEWLRIALNVRTYADLAALTADEIDEKLRADSHIAAHASIESWILQAQGLVDEVTASIHPVGEASVEAAKGANSSARNGGWKPYASFVVEFQARLIEGRQTVKRTAVHHIETDRGEFWHGAESKQLCWWILEQAGETAQPEEADVEVEEVGEPVPSAEAPVKVQIGQIQAFQPPLTEFPNGNDETAEKLPEVIKSSEPFNLGISFSLTGAAAESISKSQAIFRTRAYVTSVDTGSSFDLGEVMTDSLIEGKVDYNTMLTATTLEPGTYQLWVTVTVQTAYTIPDFIKGSLFNVV